MKNNIFFFFYLIYFNFHSPLSLSSSQKHGNWHSDFYKTFSSHEQPNRNVNVACALENDQYIYNRKDLKLIMTEYEIYFHWRINIRIETVTNDVERGFKLIHRRPIFLSSIYFMFTSTVIQ